MSNTDTISGYMANLDAGDIAGAQKHFAPEFEFVSPFGTITDLEGHAGLGEAFKSSFSGMDHQVDDAWEVEDVVFVEGTWRGTNTGPLALPDGTVLPSTGKFVEFPWAGVGRVEAGLLTSLHIYFDVASFMSQLGLMPAAA